MLMDGHMDWRAGSCPAPRLRETFLLCLRISTHSLLGDHRFIDKGLISMRPQKALGGPKKKRRLQQSRKFQSPAKGLKAPNSGRKSLVMAWFCTWVRCHFHSPTQNCEWHTEDLPVLRDGGMPRQWRQYHPGSITQT